MAQLTITIPNDQVDRVRAAFVRENLILPMPDPPTLATAEEVRLQIVDFVRTKVREYEREKARMIAQQQAETPIDIT